MRTSKDQASRLSICATEVTGKQARHATTNQRAERGQHHDSRKGKAYRGQGIGPDEPPYKNAINDIQQPTR